MKTIPRIAFFLALSAALLVITARPSQADEPPAAAPAAAAPAAPAAAPAAPAPTNVELAGRVADLEAYITNGAPKALTTTPGPGHNGWMMTCAALVLFMTLPGLALFYGGLVRRKNVLSVHGAVSRLRRPGHHPVVGGRLQLRVRTAARPFLRRHASSRSSTASTSAPNTDYAAWVSQNVFSMYQLMFAIITPGPDRRRHRRAHEVLGRSCCSSSLLDVRRLLPARAHGVGRRRLHERRLERQRQRSRPSTSPAAPSCTCPRAGRRSCSASSSASATGFGTARLPAAQPGADHGRHRHAVGRLVRLQRRQRGRRRRRRRQRLHDHHARHRRRLLRLAAARVDHPRQAHRARLLLGRGRAAWSSSRPPPASSPRPARSSSACSPAWCRSSPAPS